MNLKGQMAFAYDGRGLYESCAAALKASLIESVHYVGLKEAAYLCDTSPSQMSHAMHERKRCYQRVDWVPALVDRAPNLTFIEILAGLKGYELVKVKQLTPEEELARYRKAVADTLSPDACALVEAKVRRGG